MNSNLGGGGRFRHKGDDAAVKQGASFRSENRETAGPETAMEDTMNSPPDHLILSRVESPIGPLAVACDGAGFLRGLSFEDGLIKAMRREYPGADLAGGPAPAAVAGQIAAYFDGDREALTRVAWSLEGAVAGDGFQARVWRALAAVPAGQTISYGEMAKRAAPGSSPGVTTPGAAQAAGVALNRNPIPLILACHRVVGADGTMVGFGGGLERKTWLLRHEGALLI